MISEAYIAGQIGKAIFKRDEDYFLLETDENERCIFSPIRIMDMNSFVLSKSEITVLNRPGLTEDEICNELIKDTEKHEVLEMFLMGMDSTYSDGLRQEAMETIAHNLFANPETENFVNNRIFGTPLPQGFSALSASEIAEKAGYKHLADLYTKLNNATQIITSVVRAWKTAVLSFDNTRDVSEQSLNRAFTDDGIFADFVMAVLEKSDKAFDTAVVKHADTVRNLGFGQPALLLERIKELIYEEFPPLKQGDVTDILAMNIADDSVWDRGKPSGFAQAFSTLIDDFIGKSKRRRKVKDGENIEMAKLPTFYAGDTILRKVAWIKDKIQQGDIARAEDEILSLIKMQDISSDAEHLSKSLCDIAECFQDNNNIEMSNLIAEKAIDLNLDDPFPHNILAENYRSLNLFEDALKKYRYVIENFSNAVARNGKAETLRQMGKLQEALECYNQTINDFKDNVVARNGKAETLRQMGKLSEALECYNQTINDFKDNVVARTGKAETLRQMGKLPEALEFYNQTINDFKDNVVARSGKAETLRQMGKLEEALECYNQTINDFKDDVFARNGKAETLRQMGKLQEALDCYNQVINDFKNDVIAHCGRAETLRQMGKLQEALECYNQTINDFKYNVIARAGKAETLRQMGREKDSLSFFEETIQLFPYNNQFVKVSRLALMLQMGEQMDTLENETNIKNPVTQDDWVLFHIHCMVLLKQNKESAITKLKYGVKNNPYYKGKLYFKSTLSYAFIKYKRYGDAISELKQIDNKQIIDEVLITHAMAATNKPLTESKKHFDIIFNSPIIKVKEASENLSDRFHLRPNRFFPGVPDSTLDKKIEALEFELLAGESDSMAA